MQKRVFIVHGWGGNPSEGWFPWLKKKLEKKNIQATILSMPNTDHPTIKPWVSFLKKTVGTTDEHTYFVGHSIGCQTILRYIESIPQKTRIGGIILVAPWINLVNQTDEEMEIAKSWIETPIKWNKITHHTQNIISIFSDNDDYVPLSDSTIFEKNLHSKILIEKKKGHFSGGDNITELPIVLNALITIEH